MSQQLQIAISRLIAEKRNLYKRLGLKTSKATQAEIKAAHKVKALETHPDQDGDPEEFCKIQEAYEILSDVDARAEYDVGFQAILYAAKLGRGSGNKRAQYGSPWKDRIRARATTVNHGPDSLGDAVRAIQSGLKIRAVAFEAPSKEFDLLSGAIRNLRNYQEKHGSLTEVERIAWEEVRRCMGRLQRSLKP